MVINETSRKHQYNRKYLNIVVTFNDGGSKTFSPSEWSIFENKIRPMAKNIVFNKKSVFSKSPKVNSKKVLKSVKKLRKKIIKFFVIIKYFITLAVQTIINLLQTIKNGKIFRNFISR